jgi:TonB family protein
LSAIVDRNGNVIGTRILIASPDQALNATAENCLKQWKFSGNCDVEQRWYTTTFDFGESAE